MNERLRKAFDEIHAEEELKEKTKEFLLHQRNNHKKNRFFSSARFVPAVACLLFILIALGSYQVYFIPTSAISIDINPSIELEINRLDQVISVKGYNTDGKELAASLDVKFVKYTEALERILCSESIQAYLSSNEELSITVVGSDAARCGKILSDIETYTGGNSGIYCYTASSEDAHSAHEMGLSCGKYRAYQELKDLDPDMTVDEVQGMTMKEIRNYIEALSDDSHYDAEENDSGHHGEGHRGKNHGYGHGNKSQ